MLSSFRLVDFVREDQADEFHSDRRGYGQVSVGAFVRRGAVIRCDCVSQNGTVSGGFQHVDHVCVLQRDGIRFRLTYDLHARVLWNGDRLAILARDSKEALKDRRLIVNGARAERYVFLDIRGRLKEVHVGSVHLRHVGVGLNRAYQRLLLNCVARDMFLELPNDGVAAIRFAETIGVLVVTLLFDRTGPCVMNVSLALVLCNRPCDGAFTNVSCLVIVDVHGLICFSGRRDQFGERKGHLLLLDRVLHFFRYLFVNHGAEQGNNVEDPVLGSFIRRLVFQFRVRVLVRPNRSLRVRFKEEVFLRGFRRRIFNVRRVAQYALACRDVFHVINGDNAVIRGLHDAIGINAYRSHRRFGALEIRYVRAFVGVRYLRVLSLALRSTYLSERRFVVVQISDRGAICYSGRLLRVVNDGVRVRRVM